jgi:5-methylcytosine-specific restriction endonuclease McrA
MGRLAGRGRGSRLGKERKRLRVVVVDSGEDKARRSKDYLNTARWQRLRLQILQRDGYVCQQTGVALVGKYPAPDSPVVDHKIPHRGDPDMFWDEENLQAVSKEWHDREKQSLEKRGLA